MNGDLQTNLWSVGFFALLGGILLTIVRVIHPLLFPAKPYYPEDIYSGITITENSLKERFEAHSENMSHTLSYWKSQGVVYGRFYRYSIFWNIFSIVSLPILISEYDSRNAWAKALLITLSAWAALSSALSRGFKAGPTSFLYVKCEREYHDLTRKLRDHPELFGTSQKEQLSAYFKEVDMIERLNRDKADLRISADVL